MHRRSVLVASVLVGAAVAVGPVAAQDDVFNSDESTTTTTDQTQNATPRNDILKEAVPRLTGTFQGTAGAAWNWSDVWNSPFNILEPSSSSLNQQATELDLGFVARPDTDISFTGEIRTTYPFVDQITTGSGATASTLLVPDFTVWSLYSKFTWNDSLFFTFGKQPLKWGTGYFFSPADDVFAQTAVDVTNPTAERQGPLALKVQYPIPKTQDNLYFIAALPAANNLTTLASLQPQDIAVAAKAEFLFGNTEVAGAGYYQLQQRPRAILMATTGTGNLNFFGEGLAAFPSSQSDPYIEKTAVTWTIGALPRTSDYSVVDRSADTFYKATAGVMYTNQDWNFTAVAQYLYNGQGYDTLSVQDILQAVIDRALGQPAGEPTLNTATLASDFTGLGQIGVHYGVIYLGFTSIANTKTDFSVLGIMNLSDGSGYVNPTVSFTMFTYVKLSLGASASWGAAGTEFADPTGFASTFPTINGQPNPSYNPNYVAKPTFALTLNASVGTGSF
ncbi:MAG TPA: hypothetical protein VFH83_02290 [Spirochaetia bacterium]|nr:hypothetical protein [Spirochaetia bacterium]